MENMAKSNLIVTVILVILIIMGIYLFIKKKRDTESRNKHDNKQNDSKSKKPYKQQESRNDNDSKQDKGSNEKFKAHSANINNEAKANDIPKVPVASDLPSQSALKPPTLQKPYNVTLDLLNVSTVRINWNMAKSPSSDPSFDALPIEYAVYRYKSPGNPSQSPEGPYGEMKPETIEIATGNEYVFTDLDPISEPIQYFRIRAANSRTISDFSDVVKIELNCGLDFNSDNLDEISASVNPVYDSQTGVLTWNRILGVSGYGIFVVADKYHQQFYVAERNGEVSGFKGLDPSNTKISANPVKVLDISRIGAVNIRGILIYLVNHCGASTMLVFKTLAGS